MSILVISASLNPSSNSKILAQEAHRLLSVKHKPDWLDLREIELPHCDGNEAYGHPNVETVTRQIAAASTILMAVPIYNFDCNSAAKNLVEMTGKAWEEKTVGFLCAAGGRSSYMSIMGLANSLMLDFRSLIIPKFVYAEGSDFGKYEIKDATIQKRVEELVATALRLDGVYTSKAVSR